MTTEYNEELLDSLMSEQLRSYEDARSVEEGSQDEFCQGNSVVKGGVSTPKEIRQTANRTGSNYVSLESTQSKISKPMPDPVSKLVEASLTPSSGTPEVVPFDLGDEESDIMQSNAETSEYIICKKDNIDLTCDEIQESQLSNLNAEIISSSMNVAKVTVPGQKLTKSDTEKCDDSSSKLSGRHRENVCAQKICVLNNDPDVSLGENCADDDNHGHQSDILRVALIEKGNKESNKLPVKSKIKSFQLGSTKNSWNEIHESAERKISKTKEMVGRKPTVNVDPEIITLDHSSSENEEDGPAYQCTACLKRFAFKRFFIEHSDRISGKFQYNCANCNMNIVFSNMCQVKAHFASHNIQEVDTSLLIIRPPDATKFLEGFMCEFCPGSEAKYGITEEDLQSKSENSVKQCDVCLNWVESISKHLSSSAFGRLRFNYELLCSFCEYFAPNACSLAIHERIHTKKRPYICPECGLEFITWLYLDNHLHYDCLHYYRAHSIKCQLCGIKVRFVSSNDFNTQHHYIFNHMEKHFSILYKCYLCDINTTKKFEFLRHLEKIHNQKRVQKPVISDEYVYHKCPLCPISLVSKNGLVSHLPKHFFSYYHGLITYGYFCEECSYFTEHKEEFYKHLNKRHRKKPKEYKSHLLKNNLNSKNFDDISPITNKSPSAHERTSVVPSTTNETINSEQCSSKNVSISNAINVENLCVKKSTKPASSPGTSVKSKFKKRKKSSVNSPTFIYTVCTFECHLCVKTIKKTSPVWHFYNFHKINSNEIEKYARYVTVSNKSSDVKNDRSEEESTKDAPEDICPQINMKECKENSSRFEEVNCKLEPSNSESNETVDSITDDPKKRRLSGGICCRYCDYVCPDVDDLKKHVIHHKEKGTHQCIECGECFVAPNALEIHLISVHGVDDPKTYMDKHSLDENMEFETSVKDNQCSVCLAEFSDPVSLKSHFKIHGLAYLKKINRKK